MWKIKVISYTLYSSDQNLITALFTVSETDCKQGFDSGHILHAANNLVTLMFLIQEKLCFVLFFFNLWQSRVGAATFMPAVSYGYILYSQAPSCVFSIVHPGA